MTVWCVGGEVIVRVYPSPILRLFSVPSSDPSSALPLFPVTLPQMLPSPVDIRLIASAVAAAAVATQLL